MEASACLKHYKMLIKKRKLTSIKGGKETPRAISPEHAEISKAIQLEIQKAKAEAKRIKEEAILILEESEKKLKFAENRANEIISKTVLEAKAIKEKVFNETLQVANKQAEQIRNQAKILLQELFNVKRQALTQANKEIIKVALDLAEKIIRYKVSVDPDILQTQVIEAIKKATSEADRVQVFVNPNDLKNLEEKIPQMEKLFPSGIDIVPLANDSIDPGSCIIETKSGQLDARFSTQLQTLTDLLSHLDIAEPEIEINEEVKVIEDVIAPSPGEILEDFEDEGLQEAEKELLEKELLSEESLIVGEEEGSFPFISSEVSPSVPLKLEDEELAHEREIVKIPDEVIQDTYEQEIKQEIKNEEITLPQQEPKIISNNETETTSPVQDKKRRLSITPIPERTKEEAEELDEGLVFEYEEETTEEKKEAKPQNILKPKKSSSEVSDIASELENNPEWKNVVEEE